MYELIAIEKELDLVRDLALETEESTSSLLSLLESYENQTMSPRMRIYTENLLSYSLDAMEGLESKLYEVSNYQGSITESTLENHNINYLTNNDIYNDDVKYKRSVFIKEIESIKNFADQVVTQINYQKTNGFLISNLDN